MSEVAPAKSLFHPSRRHFLLRKLHSLSGVVPVGGFLVFHLWTNAKALQGQEAYDRAVADIGRMPYVPVLEIGLIILPLAFHALYGVKLAFEGKSNVGKYPYARNWMYTLQRVTGIVAFLFVGFHLWEYWGPKWLGRMAPEQFYPALSANLSSMVGPVPLIGLIYLVGIAASVFHFANGLWGFCFSWGITVSRRAQATAAWVFGVLGLLLFLLGANTAIYFSTGSRLFGSASLGARTGVDVPTP
ncbi:succinate dehydrogenase [Chondromyces crocatus]|uniref:Succinate dehydrogenase n=1 Tax=Chondromyces crocatus TaxID=52 RepID=A0A0K1E5Y5_CHOCO|nr:succinate dehydrogenase [Chondromyces crocatus]AKT36290.1 succinate dehydrogenase [Chondromyces crocatus]